ncbi:MAG: TonB-dependent receptor [Chitinophagaceae bacterium]|nr:MAG: TonB-dependent receptor [Chitinophagaceae bacterium]
MKKLFLGICYLMISQTVISQQISGRVTDAATGTAVAAATVALGTNTATLTNDSGYFEFRQARQRDYQLTVSSIGYRTATKQVNSGNNGISITLQPINLMMQPVEVRALRAGDKAPFTKTNISKAEVEKLNIGQDIPFILNQTPSVVVNSDAGNGVGYTGIRIRGSDATRINMTINGIPYNDAESQGLFFVNLPDFASSINSVQIQRGVGTSSNGAGAFGASMNFSTSEVNTNGYAEINNSAGSFNTWKHTVKAGSGLIADHFTFDARLSRLSSEGFVDRASSDLSSFYLSGAYLTKKSSLRLNVFSGKEKTYQAWNGIPENMLETNRRFNSSGTEKPGDPYDNETDNYQQDHFQLLFNHQLNSKVSFNTALFLSNGKGYYENYRAGEAYANYGLPDFVTANDTVPETDLVRQLWLDNSYYGQVFSVQYKDTRSALTIGGGWNRYDGNHFGDVIWATAGFPAKYRWYDLNAYKTDVNGYAKYQRTVLPGLDLFADLQYRRILYDLGGFRNNPKLHIRNTYNFINPKAGISYSRNNYLFYASYATGNKEPNRDDFEAGLAEQPRPERLHDFELGVERKTERYSWSAVLYYMLYKNQLVQTGKINDVGVQTRTNIPDSYRMGVELQGRLLLTEWMNISGNLTLSRNRIKNFTEFIDDYDAGGQKVIDHGETDISFSPAVTGFGALNLSPIKNMEINLFSKYVSRQFLDNTSDKARSIDDYFVQDIRASYSLKGWLARDISLSAQVFNLFDRRYESNGYTFSYFYDGALTTENYYYPMAGINFMVGLNIKL